MKYLLTHPVVGKTSGEKHRTEIHWRNGILITDEPVTHGGQDLGPDPYTLLLSSLISCTIATLRMYIDYKGLPVSAVRVEANMFQKIIDTETVTMIERKINVDPNLPGELMDRLKRVAANCPVSKILRGTIDVITEIEG